MLMYMQREYRSSVLPERNQGFSGRFTYDYGQRYLVELNFGYNGTERLAKKERFEFFPAVSLGWVISNEKFFEPMTKYIDNLKIRGSYGLVGSDETGLSAGAQHFLYIDQVSLNNIGFTTGVDMNYTLYGPLVTNYAVVNGGWERVKKLDIGIDLELFRQLTITADYFNEKRYNILLHREAWPESLGYYTAKPWSNKGKVDNWGIELSVGFNQDLGPVNWNSNLIYSMNRNEIKELLPEYVTDRTTSTTVKSPTEFSVASADSYRMILKEGGTMSDIYATKLKQDLHGDILISNGGVSAEENTFIKVGSAAPKYNLGFRNSFSWKGVELDFLIDARVGGEVISATQALMDQFGVSQQTATARDNGGVPVNNGKLDAEQYYGTVASGKTGLLAHYVYSATNVRLREMSLSYMLPAKWFGEKLNISLSLTGHNLLMFYKKAPFDPELTANTGTYYQGFDYFMPPSLRSFGFGVKVNF
jgi:hypothetical protein